MRQAVACRPSPAASGAPGNPCAKIFWLMWLLKTVTEGFPETTFRILPGGIRTIGRSTGADFILDAALVSRVHCRLTVLNTGELEIRDLKSTNGTYVNGEPVAASRLEPGDRVQVGRVELVAEREE